MTFKIVVENEKGEQEVFLGETPYQAALESVSDLKLKGESFSLNLFKKEKKILGIYMINAEELATELNKFLDFTKEFTIAFVLWPGVLTY